MFVVADAARFDTSRLQESRRERILRVADSFAAHLAEYLRHSSFVTNDESPRRTQRISFAQFALGRLRPFFKDAGRSYRRQVGSRQPPDRPAGGVGRAFPSIRLPIVIWFPSLLQPIDSILGTTSDSCLSTHFNAKTRQSGSMDLQGLATPSRKLALSLAPAHVSAECELLETLHTMTSIRQAHNTLKRATCRTGEK